MIPGSTRSLRRSGATFLAIALAAWSQAAVSAEFSVTPIRAELKPGTLSETISVSNESPGKLRVSVKLVEWTQDEKGADVYKDSNDLVYFPRQMDLEPGTKRLVRVGAKTPSTTTEKTYRLFLEEVPEANASGSSVVNFYFRFGVPVFLPPPNAKPEPTVGEPSLAGGKMSISVANPGNQHFRLHRVVVTDGASFRQEVAGWYSLAGTQRVYTADIPRDVCRRGGALTVRLEGENANWDRKLHVDPARCS
jgi:fimbrial chaperone protein